MRPLTLCGIGLAIERASLRKISATALAFGAFSLVLAWFSPFPVLLLLLLFVPASLAIAFALDRFEHGFLVGLFFVPLIHINLPLGIGGKTLNYDKIFLSSMVVIWFFHKLREPWPSLNSMAKAVAFGWLANILANALSGLTLSAGHMGQFWFLMEKIFLFAFFLMTLDVVQKLRSKGVLHGVLVCSMNIVVLLAVAQWFIWWTGAGEVRLFYAAGKFSYLPIFSTIGHPNFYAVLVNLCFPLTVVAFFGHRFWQPLLVLLLSFQVLTISWTHSLAGLLGTVLSGIYLSVTLPMKSKAWRILAAALVLLFLAVNTALWGLRDAQSNPIAVRWYILGLSSALISGSPVLGSGMGSFPRRFAEVERQRVPNSKVRPPHGNPRGTPVSAHNAYLLEFVEGGGVGLLTLLAIHLSFAFALFRASSREGKRGLRAKAALAAALSFWFHALAEDLFSFTKLMILFLAVISPLLLEEKSFEVPSKGV